MTISLMLSCAFSTRHLIFLSLFISLAFGSLTFQRNNKKKTNGDEKIVFFFHFFDEIEFCDSNNFTEYFLRFFNKYLLNKFWFYESKDYQLAGARSASLINKIECYSFGLRLSKSFPLFSKFILTHTATIMCDKVNPQSDFSSVSSIKIQKNKMFTRQSRVFST